MTDRLNGMTRDSDAKHTVTQSTLQELKCMVSSEGAATRSLVSAEGAATRALIENTNKDNQIRELQAALCETKQRNISLEMNFANGNPGNGNGNGKSYRTAASM